jgi:hypothetical protein
LNFALAVFGQAPGARQLSETTRNDPAAWLHLETSGARLALHNLQLPAVPLLSAPVGQLLATVGGVSPDLLEPRHTEREARYKFARTGGVREVGGGDVDGNRQPEGIDEQMAFAPFNLCAAVVAADAGGVFDRLHALRIHDRGARVRLPAHTFPLGRMQGTVEAEPEALDVPAPKMVEDRLPGGEVGGQIAPGAAGA